MFSQMCVILSTGGRGGWDPGGIYSTPRNHKSGRYVSYWNAFLFFYLFCLLPAAMKLGQGNIFTGVCLSTGGRGVCLSACWDTHPPRPDTPPDQAPPPEQTPRADPPRDQTPPRPGIPPREADCSIRLTSGRYASYWNAFLLCDLFRFRSHFRLV